MPWQKRNIPTIWDTDEVGHGSNLMSAKARGKKLGRPRADEMKRLKAISRLPKQSVGINKIARQLGIGVSGVQRIVNAQ